MRPSSTNPREQSPPRLVIVEIYPAMTKISDFSSYFALKKEWQVSSGILLPCVPYFVNVPAKLHRKCNVFFQPFLHLKAASCPSSFLAFYTFLLILFKNKLTAERFKWIGIYWVSAYLVVVSICDVGKNPVTRPDLDWFASAIQQRKASMRQKPLSPYLSM